jgi:hypothetical protein
MLDELPSPVFYNESIIEEFRCFYFTILSYCGNFSLAKKNENLIFFKNLSLYSDNYTKPEFFIDYCAIFNSINLYLNYECYYNDISDIYYSELEH